MSIMQKTSSITFVFLLAACGGGGGGGGGSSPGLASSNQVTSNQASTSNRYDSSANLVETFAGEQGFLRINTTDNQEGTESISYALTAEANSVVEAFDEPDFDLSDFENDDYDNLTNLGNTPTGQTIRQGTVDFNGVSANITAYVTTDETAALSYQVFPDLTSTQIIAGVSDFGSLPSGTFEYTGTFTAGDWNYSCNFNSNICTDNAHDVGNFRMDVDFDNAVITDFIAGVPLDTPINRFNPDEIYNSTTLEWSTLLSASNISINTSDGSFATTQGDLRTLPENLNFTPQTAPYYNQSDAKIYGAFGGQNAETVSGTWYEFPNETGRNSGNSVNYQTTTPSMAGGFVGSR